MYKEIQRLAEEALALQNKDRMEAALRKISALCDQDGEQQRGTTSFGLAHIKKEGAAIHPDDMDATMTDEQYDRQLAAHERDVAAASAAPTKAKGRKGGAQ